MRVRLIETVEGARNPSLWDPSFEPAPAIGVSALPNVLNAGSVILAAGARNDFVRQAGIGLSSEKIRITAVCWSHC